MSCAVSVKEEDAWAVQAKRNTQAIYFITSLSADL